MTIIRLSDTPNAALKTIAGAKMVIPAANPRDIKKSAAVNSLVFRSKRCSRNW